MSLSELVKERDLVQFPKPIKDDDNDSGGLVYVLLYLIYSSTCSSKPILQLMHADWRNLFDHASFEIEKLDHTSEKFGDV